MGVSLKRGQLVSAVTTVSTSTAAGPANEGWKSFHAVLTGSGAISCTAKIQVSNDNTNFIDLATITLSGTTAVSDGFSGEAPWAYYRVDVTAISGTAASLTVTVGGI